MARQQALQVREKVPVVSVIVPSYNKPEYLPECLRSIQAQTFPDWECIVVDDGSPRGEEIRAAVEAMQDSRFRLVRHERNRGPGAARNTGVKNARADLLIWVDEDDWLKAECLEKLLAAKSATGADLVHPGCEFDNGRPRKVWLPTRDEILHSSQLLGAGFVVNRDYFEKIGGFDESTDLQGREDFEWWIRVIWAKSHILLVNDSLYVIRKSNGSRAELSLNSRTRRLERRIREYIINKHVGLYLERKAAKRLFIAKGYWREGEWNAEHGRLILGAWLMLISVLRVPRLSRIRSFLRYWWNIVRRKIVRRIRSPQISGVDAPV